MLPEYKKLLKNTGLFAIGTFATSLLGLLMTPLYTSILSTGDYGVADLITVTTSLLMPLVTLAVFEGIMRYSLDKNADYNTIFTLGVLLSLGGSLLVALFLPLISLTPIGEYKWFFIAYFSTNTLYTIVSYFIKGIEKIKTYTIGGVIGSFVFICSNLFFLLYLKIGVDGYILSFILGSLIPTIYFFYTEKLYQYITIPSLINKRLIKDIIIYSLPIIPNGISWWIANSSDRYILNYYADVSEVGIYSVSYKIPTIMMTIMGFFVASWQLSSVDEFGSEKSKAFFSDIYNKYVLASVMLASLLIVFAKPFASFLYAKDFFVAWQYVPVLVIANVFNILSSFMGTVYTGAKKTKMLSLSTMMGAGSNILLNFLLIPHMGAMGAAIATAFSYVVIQTFRVIHSKQIMSFDVNYKKNLFLYVLIINQAYFVIQDTVVGVIVSVLITVLVMYICRYVFADVIKIVATKTKS